MNKNLYLHMRMDEETRAKLDKLARHYGLTASAVITMLISERSAEVERRNAMKRYTEQEKKAIMECAKHADYEEDDVQDLLDSDTITVNTGRDGKEYAYFLDETRCFAVRVDSLTLVESEAEIEALFA